MTSLKRNSRGRHGYTSCDNASLGVSHYLGSITIGTEPVVVFRWMAPDDLTITKAAVYCTAVQGSPVLQVNIGEHVSSRKLPVQPGATVLDGELKMPRFSTLEVVVSAPTLATLEEVYICYA